MIEKLTDAQEAKLPEYREEWLAVGLSTEPSDRERAERAIPVACENAGVPVPELVVWCASPLGLVWAHHMVTVDDITDPGRVWDGAFDRVKSGERPKAPGGILDNICYGNHNAEWLGFFEFFRNECGLKVETESLVGLTELARSTGWFMPFERVWFMAERPTSLHRNEGGQLHRDGEAALAYPDGWGVWALNGVRCPKWLIETPAAELDPERVLGIENAEVRVRGVSKIGVERLVHLGKVIDRRGDMYRLLEMPIGADGRNRIYLDMKNASVPGVNHVEAVHPGCRSVQDALNYRHSGLSPSQHEGEDWKPRKVA